MGSLTVRNRTEDMPFPPFSWNGQFQKGFEQPSCLINYSCHSLFALPLRFTKLTKKKKKMKELLYFPITRSWKPSTRAAFKKLASPSAHTTVTKSQQFYPLAISQTYLFNLIAAFILSVEPSSLLT